MSRSVEFFDTQFKRQVQDGEFELNPFERLALAYLHGAVLDLGCGLGNLALEAARRGCTVTAIDASATAIARIRDAAQEEQLAVEALEADLTRFGIGHDYDTIVAIGLLMFFPQARALAMLRDIQANVRPGGRAIVNVLIEGTTYMDMFTPSEYYVFRREELVDSFADWVIDVAQYDDFSAPSKKLKVFSTVIARKPKEKVLNVPEYSLVAETGSHVTETAAREPA
jgi:tellurite methyltransferase